MTLPSSSSQPSLYDQIGGESAVNSAVDIFYRRVIADELLAPFFVNLDMDRQIKKQKEFLTLAFGGPSKYSGKSLRGAHAKLVKERGLDDAHFDAVASHLQSSLRELNVADSIIQQVMSVAESTRNDVLGR